MQSNEITKRGDNSRLAFGELEIGKNFLTNLVDGIAGDVHKSALRNPKKLQKGLAVSERMLLRARRNRNSENHKQWAAIYRCYKYLFDVSQIPETLRKVVKHGWFLPIDLALELAHQSDLYAEGQESKLDDFLYQHFKKEISKLSLKLYSLFPDRAKIIAESIEAHDSAMFFVSVPVFLAQADGICRGVLYKSKKGKKVKLKDFLLKELLEDADIIELITQVITEVTGIDAPSHSVPINVLNRHAVLHGESLNYGTEVNSLKAFSLLAFIGSLM